MSAMRVFLTCVAIIVAPTLGRAAATEADAAASLSAAVAMEAKAREAQAAWTPTETALAAAKKALDSKNFELAKQQADEALALAKRSLEQAEQQKSVWRDAVVR